LAAKIQVIDWKSCTMQVVVRAKEQLVAHLNTALAPLHLYLQHFAKCVPYFHPPAPFLTCPQHTKAHACC
jgi:hypothetical protein